MSNSSREYKILEDITKEQSEDLQQKRSHVQINTEMSGDWHNCKEFAIDLINCLLIRTSQLHIASCRGKNDRLFDYQLDCRGQLYHSEFNRSS